MKCWYCGKEDMEPKKDEKGFSYFQCSGCHATHVDLSGIKIDRTKPMVASDLVAETINKIAIHAQQYKAKRAKSKKG